MTEQERQLRAERRDALMTALESFLPEEESELFGAYTYGELLRLARQILAVELDRIRP